MTAGGDTIDPRATRSQQAMRDAAIELARTMPVEDIAVSDVARRAGVARGTLYNHGSSPADLVRDVLLEELTGQRERFQVELPLQEPRAAFRQAVVELIEHVRANIAVYSSSDRSAIDPVLRVMLSEFLQESTRQYLALRPIAYETFAELSGGGTAVSREVVAVALASLTVGAIDAWLAQGGGGAPAELAAVVLALIPDVLLD